MSKRVFTQSFGVVGAIIEKDGKIILVREQGRGKSLDKGKWNQPAGWIDVGENPIKSVKREVLEETGFEFEPTHLIGVYSLVRDDMTQELGSTPHAIKLIFKGKITSEVRHELAADITETKWFDPEEIYAMDNGTLRDEDIKQEVKDYFAGKETSLTVLTHTVQKP